MQLRGISENVLILANEGNTDKEIFCPECLFPLRTNKKGYFCHKQKNILCRSYRKNFKQIQVLQLLSSCLPKDEIFVEKPFYQIGKIADISWERYKIVFQVLCPSPDNIQEEYQAFLKAGYELVWILDDRVYNQKKLKKEELAFSKKNYYFARIEKKGGYIYDQLEIVHQGQRTVWGPPLPIELLSPIRVPPFNRVFGRSLYFPGDLLSHHMEKKTNVLLKLRELEERIKNNPHSSLLRNFYKIGLRILLEKSAF